MGFDRIISSQPQYNMIWRVIESEVMPLCEKEGIGQIVWSPIAQGVLTGKYLPGAELPAGSRATDASGSRFIKDYLTEPILTRVQQPQAGGRRGRAVAGPARRGLDAAEPERRAAASSEPPGRSMSTGERQGRRGHARPQCMAEIDEILGPVISRPGGDGKPAHAALGRPGYSRPGAGSSGRTHACVLEQGDLIDAGVQQVAPVLAEPGLGVALAAEALLRQPAGAGQTVPSAFSNCQVQVMAEDYGRTLAGGESGRRCRRTSRT